MPKHLALTMLIGSLLFAGCSKTVPYNSNTGEDGSRITAVILEVNQPRTGDLSGITGDNEDWFYFVPPEEGEVEISVSLENPEMALSMSLTDDYGRQLQEKQCSDAVNVYHLDKVQVTKDRYFIALKTAEGVGAYTLIVDLIKPEPVVEEVEIPEEAEKTTTSTTSTSSCVPADKCKAGQKCCKSKNNNTSTNNTDNTNNNDTNSQNTSTEVKIISGTIVLNTPRGDGLSDIKISGISKSKNIKPGMKAVLRGLNRKVDIYQCMNTSCLATVNATSEELKRYDTVDVYVE